MKQETINSDYEMRLMALRQLQSQTGEELDALSPSPNGDGSQSVLRSQEGMIKGELC